MKFVDEYRDSVKVEACVQAIRSVATRNWTLMEVCGGQTHTIVKYALDELLAPAVTLLHGPGCPVCVTPTQSIDQAIAIASRPGATFCSFGDMLRVPGSRSDLLRVKAQGGDVRIVYSPTDAVLLAQKHPDRQVVFFAVGFETTAPANAMAVLQAAEQGVSNFSMLVSQVLVPPAIRAILDDPDNRMRGLLAAGHVCTIMGFEEYADIASRYRIPIVITGFEPLDIVQGVYLCVRQLQSGRCEVENQYARSVRREGNLHAQNAISRVFRVSSKKWRGIGAIPESGLSLREEFSFYDAELRFAVTVEDIVEPGKCISGAVLRGAKKPQECPAFGAACSPEHPLGAPMVSNEGACATYYHYRSHAGGAR